MSKYKNVCRLILLTLLSFVINVFSNGKWCIPIFAWVYPVLFLYMLYSYHSVKILFILFGIYVVGFIFQFSDVMGMDFWICVITAILLAAFKLLPYLLWTCILSENKFSSLVLR